MIPDFENVKLVRFDKAKGIMYAWKGGGKIHVYKLNGKAVKTIDVAEKEKVSFRYIKDQMNSIINEEKKEKN